ncbi:hypothetical protein ACQ4LE_004916 [Meloidogyne hapla]|uniref:Transmembrane protein 33 n=1 Tax=Meloidogyne hapla TaxID=6305 RepID=A0A1I8B6B2_MELHA
MVEIREETSDSQNASGNASAQQPNNANAHRKTPIEFVKEYPNDVLAFGLRLATLYFVICYILPITDSTFQAMAYTKAFAAVAATNAFRLHQRLRAVNWPFFSQMFLYELMLEDSAHYLLYCMIFVISSPITLALLPVSIYAIFNLINTLNKFSNETGFARNSSLISRLVQFKQQSSPNMLSTAACAEIFLLPLIIFMIFMGKASLIGPFVYYRFLTMRYMSRRNPYTREMFTQLKFIFTSFANNPSCPAFVSSSIFKCVALLERLAPQQVAM